MSPPGSAWNLSARLIRRGGPPGGEVERRRCLGQLSPLTAPPHSAVLSDRAYPSPLVRYQWAKLPEELPNWRTTLVWLHYTTMMPMQSAPALLLYPASKFASSVK